ncbi:TrlF family AAA-like ATPase [Rubrobacter indicoceani]|uniref:TrlF family AAA-like ATPase n=1 Tax=Rubrobacter indicoceani TaxID=2051957 RepID=UPI0013C52489|nr:hypothetical protein [Rubrobacter indicoceani]
MKETSTLAYPGGSTWCKWDLHVHTPESLVQDYGGSNKAVWEKFLQDLESLPPEFKVLGINDYIFLDGYKKVLKEKRQGRLENIELLLPVVELRLDKFGGTESGLSRVNYHVIFSDEVDADTIEHHLINTLSNSFRLAPDHASLARKWNSNITRKSLEELGKLITESTPKEKRGGNLSPLHVGFSNLTFKLEDIRERLDFHHFEGRHLTAVGKTEWANIKWNSHAADKKDVINAADLVFVASKTPGEWKSAKDSLRQAGVNDLLLDCSDAHRFSSAFTQKDRIGNCHTWIKAAPTFEGLLHALEEPDERIFVGEEPLKVGIVRKNATKYVQSVSIGKVASSSLDERWFDDRIEFNADFVAIIGNKGSGKSALVDVLGLLGDTKQADAFSFLKKDKFKEPKDNKAEHFEATLTWKSGKQVTKRLDDEVDGYAVESIKYIPQSYLETICNEVARGEGKKFREELESVIFSHVGDADRLDTQSLGELLDYKTHETHEAMDALAGELSSLNVRIVALEKRSTEDYRKNLERRLDAKREELAAHEEAKPREVPRPGTNPESQEREADVSDELERAKLERQLWVELIAAEQAELKRLTRLLSASEKAISGVENIRHRYLTAEAELSEGLNELGIETGEVVELKVDLTPLEEARKLYELLRDRSDELLDADNLDGHAERLGSAEEDILALQAQLDTLGKEHEAYLSALEAWNVRRQELVGSEDTIGSLKHTERLVSDLKEVPQRLQDAYRLRRKKAAEIHREITRLADIYRDLYDPVQRFIEGHPLAEGKFDLNFEVSIAEEGFENRFFDQINRGKSGSFWGPDGGSLLAEILDKYDFQDEASMLEFLDDVVGHLRCDKRAGNGGQIEVSEQLKQGYSPQSLYDYVFSLDYLKPRYSLRMGDKELSQLSPGERGTLLLLFYLLIDKEDGPLVIDQPDENLDNQTISELLVPCIREAKKHRQLFLVTHNPNIAVVGDAEQIVWASIDRKGGNSITYTSGPLEDFDINETAVNVLEGTMPAFDNRRSKYRTKRAE